jgi:hypothetical protein
VDTPVDTVERLEMENLVAQNQLLVNMLHKFLGDATLSENALKRVEALKKMDELDRQPRGTVLRVPPAVRASCPTARFRTRW